MSQPRRPIREHFAPPPEPLFRWRSREVTRVEGFSDAVFAFAVSLLVMALEVPRTFDGLRDVVRAFPAFAASFGMIYLFWSLHYRYFRRYGLEDAVTRRLTAVLLLLVLFSAYPLKFIFGLLFQELFAGVGVHAHGEHTIVVGSADEMVSLFRLYGLGLAAIFGIYANLYVHAFRLRATLRLTRAEELLTRRDVTGFFLAIAACFTSAMLAGQVRGGGATLPYLLLLPALLVNRWAHHRAAKAAEEDFFRRREAARH